MDHLRSTTIHHDVRRKFRLTIDEYCLADSIYRLSNNLGFPWCKVEKRDLGKSLDMSERSVYRKLEKLIKKGLIETSNDGIRATDLWRDTVEFLAKVAKKSAKVAKDFAKVATPSIYNSSTNSSTNTQSAPIGAVIKAFQPVNPSYERFYPNKTQRDAAERLIKQWGLQQVLNVISILPGINGERYAPVITSPAQLESKWASLAAFIHKNKKEEKDIIGL